MKRGVYVGCFPAGMRIEDRFGLAAEAGFEVVEVVHDSDGLAHYGSELYRRDIPLMDERSPFVNPSQKTFTKEELAGFIQLDAKLNETGEADCAAFYLYRR